MLRTRFLGSVLALAVSAFGCLKTTEAAAADLLAPYDPGLTQPVEKVEFGTGWYIRGDLAYAGDSLPHVSLDGTFPTVSSVRSTYSAGLGGGYQFNQWLRGDIVGDFREPLSATNNLGGVKATVNRWDLLANAYVDLGTWYGVTPYVGAGAGVTWGRARLDLYNQNLEYTYTPRAFAWALMAGAAYQILPHLYLDAGYRFLNLGTYSMFSRTVWAQLPVGAGESIAKSSRVNEFRVGLRYMID